MHQDASSSVLTMSRSIQNASSSMHIKQFVLYIDPPALTLTFMSDGVVRAKIQQLSLQVKFREVLELKGLPPRTHPQATTAQASTSAESEATGETATPEEIARNKAGETILKATFRHAKKIYGDEPPLQPGLSGVDIPFNQGYGFQNMEGIIKTHGLWGI